MAKPRGRTVKTKLVKPTTKSTTRKKAPSERSRVKNMGMKKQYLKSKKISKVTFRLPKIAAPGAKTVCVVGEFNDWSIYANPMKKLKNGDFTLTLELKPGREYQFRYLVDESQWENDWNADKYEKSPYGNDNSVVIA